MSAEIIIYADESDKRGTYYSDFYGGALVISTHLNECINRLEKVQAENNLEKEIKWTKVTENYLHRYQSMMEEFFDLIYEKKIKIRIMFTANRNIPLNLTRQQREESFFRLYYQFFKHAFGLQYVNKVFSELPILCRLNLDQLPDTKEKNIQFKGYLEGLSYSKKLRNKIIIKSDQIAEVRSHDHIILQCLDVVLGSMSFRLNDKHKIKKPDSRFRGKRTIAKEKLYKYINSRIREIYPNFNIGISTGAVNEVDKWHHPYRHWLFIPSDYRYDKMFEK